MGQAQSFWAADLYWAGRGPENLTDLLETRFSLHSIFFFFFFFLEIIFGEARQQARKELKNNENKKGSEISLTQINQDS